MSVKWVRLHYHPVDTSIHIVSLVEWSTRCSANSRGKSVKGKSSFPCSVGRNKGRMSVRNLIRFWFNLCLPWCCWLCSPFRESPRNLCILFILFPFSYTVTTQLHNVAVDVVVLTFIFRWIIFQNHNVEWQHTTFSNAANCSHLEVSWKCQNLFPWYRMKSCCAVNDPACKRCELLR